MLETQVSKTKNIRLYCMNFIYNGYMLPWQPWCWIRNKNNELDLTRIMSENSPMAKHLEILDKTQLMCFLNTQLKTQERSVNGQLP